LQFLTDDSDVLVKKIKANFKTLGPKYGKMMKQIAGAINKFTAEDIKEIEKTGVYTLNIDGEQLQIDTADVEIATQDIPGWAVSNLGELTVALDISISDELLNEGIAREFINRIQNLRKDSGFDVTDKINIDILINDSVSSIIDSNLDYICSETLTVNLQWIDADLTDSTELDLGNDIIVKVKVSKI